MAHKGKNKDVFQSDEEMEMCPDCEVIVGDTDEVVMCDVCRT
jgi:hypothetical protein